jgi:alkylation response protein AidB-like acyl-CoA dehydrogenase
MTITDATPDQLEVPRTPADVIAMARRIGSVAAPHAARHDREGSFVTEGYEAIRANGFGIIAVPRELGGGGHDLETVCRALAVLARYCTNTALAISMHQHNVLSLAWRWRLGDRAVERTLRRIAFGDVILSSSGSADPANPGVTAIPVEGGLLVTGRKRFCSGVPGADLVLTMARVEEGGQQWTTTVLIPTSDPGTEIIPDWDALGMRGSGSNPVSFTDVFVPDANVLEFEPLWSLPGHFRPGRVRGARRAALADDEADEDEGSEDEADDEYEGDEGENEDDEGDDDEADDDEADDEYEGDDDEDEDDEDEDDEDDEGDDDEADDEYEGDDENEDDEGDDDEADDEGEAAPERLDGHRLPALQIALAVIAAVYLGAAGGVRDRAMHMAAGRGADDPIRQRLAGLLTQEFRSAWWALDALIADTNDDSLGTEGHFITTMLAKRQVILSSIRIVELAMELLGSQTYMRALPFEQALRDVRAGITHPLAPEKTLLEVGQSALNFFANQQSSR